jgi:hypothetical protein
VIAPAQTVSMDATLIAPTSTSAMGPAGVSNNATTRSLRANRFGAIRAVSGETLNSLPGTCAISRNRPASGM